MINLGTQMQSINLNKFRIEHDSMCGIENMVAVPVHFCQKLWENKEKRADILIHGRHELPSLQIINYPKYITLVTPAGTARRLDRLVD